MHWIYPQFLWALLALSIPILIHLFQFRRFKRIVFPTVRFLDQILQENSAVSKLKHWMVLLTRLAMLAFIILAFAQPYFENDTAINPAQHILIAVDNSLSMQCTADGKPLLAIAKSKAQEVINAYPLATKFTIITAEPLLYEQKNLNNVDAQNFLQSLNYCFQSSNYNRFFAEMHSPYDAIHVFADFQKGAEFSTSYDTSSVKVFIHTLKPTVIDNAWIDTLYTSSPVFVPNASQQWIYRVRNLGAKKSTNISFQVNEQLKYVINAELPKDGYFADTIDIIQPSQQWNKATLKITDALDMQDNAQYLAWKSQEPLTVVEVYNNTPKPYFKTAFALDQVFIHEQIKATNTSLPINADFIILNEIPALNTGIKNAILGAMQRGCDVLFIPTGNLKDDNEIMTQLGQPLFVGLLNQRGRFEKFNNQESMLNQIFTNRDIKAFDISYNNILQAGAERNWIVKDGFGLPLIQYNQSLNSKFYSINFLAEGSNFYQSVLFLPLMYEMAFQNSQTQAWQAFAGQPFAFINAREVDANDKVELKQGNQSILTAIQYQNGSKVLAINNTQLKPGFAEVLVNESQYGIIGFNGDKGEANLIYEDEESIEKIFNNTGFINLELIPTEVSASKLSATVKNSRGLWYYCILFASLLILLEMLLLRKIN